MRAPAPSAWILCCSTWKYFLELPEMLDGPCKGFPERLDTELPEIRVRTRKGLPDRLDITLICVSKTARTAIGTGQST